jgi:hypothetical protein
MADNLPQVQSLLDRLKRGDFPDDWPKIPHGSTYGSPGDRLPKCSLLDCANPAVIRIGADSLTTPASWHSWSCAEHVEHLALSAAEWVR